MLLKTNLYSSLHLKFVRMSMKIMQKETDKVFFHYLLDQIFVIVTSSVTCQTSTLATGLAYTGTKYF